MLNVLDGTCFHLDVISLIDMEKQVNRGKSCRRSFMCRKENLMQILFRFYTSLQEIRNLVVCLFRTYENDKASFLDKVESKFKKDQGIPFLFPENSYNIHNLYYLNVVSLKQLRFPIRKFLPIITHRVNCFLIQLLSFIIF